MPSMRARKRSEIYGEGGRQVTTYLTDEEVGLVDEYAERKGVSRAEALRVLIRSGMWVAPNLEKEKTDKGLRITLPITDRQGLVLDAYKRFFTEDSQEKAFYTLVLFAFREMEKMISDYIKEFGYGADENESD